MGGARQLILASALLVAAAAATPARAVDVVGNSARLRWTPAAGPVAAYAVWVIHQGVQPPSVPSLATLTNEITVNGAVGDSFQVQVAAFDASGVVGPRSPLSAPIRFVSAPGPSSPPRLVLSTQSVSLTATRGSSAAPVRVGIGNGGGGSLSWTAATSARWLVLGPAAQGTAPGSLEIGAATWGLPPGRYQATVSVTPKGASGPPQSIQVSFTVQARRRQRPAPGPATANASAAERPTALSFGGTTALDRSALGLAATTSAGQNAPARSSGMRPAGAGTGTEAPARTRPYDLDGDGHADLVLRDASGAYQVTLLGDSGPIARAPLGATPPGGGSLAGSGDLDADGKADLIWNDPNAGALQLWLMDGARPSATRTLPLGGRSLVAIGDFDGDGKADLLLDAGGALELWRMDGLQVAAITSGITGLGGARVVLAQDLNGDGRADLLAATGAGSSTRYAAFTLAGTRLDSLLPLPTPAASLAVVAAGPCASDGAPGILLRDSLSGGLVLWTLGRQGVKSQVDVGLALPLEWELSATGDFSGDGRTDLLVRHRTSGTLVVLALDGPSLVGGFQVDDALPSGTAILNR